MNLKEAFRYQNFLEKMMGNACESIINPTHALTTTKSHARSKVNPDAEDLFETVEVEPFAANNDVIRFIMWLIDEREKLTKAINATKACLDIDIDAAIATNKFRQMAGANLNRMLGYKTSRRVESGRDYKFNVEGNQMPYYYDIIVETSEAYDRHVAKDFMRSVIACADRTSAEVDRAMINSTVDYEPRFDVNEAFEDVVEEFLRET